MNARSFDVAVAVAVTTDEEAAKAIQQFVVPDGTTARLFLLDVSLDGTVSEAAGAARIRGPSFTLGDALSTLASEVGSAPVVLRRADSAYDPAQLPAMVAAFAEEEGASFITSSIGLAAGAEVLHVIDPSRDGSRPPQCWDAGLGIRASALGNITGAAWFPSLLGAYLTALDAGRTHHLEPAYALISQETFASERFPHFSNLHLLSAHEEPFGLDVPWLSIIVPFSKPLSDAAPCLESLFAQVLPGGTFEVVAVDRGDGTLAEVLNSLSFRQPCQATHAPGGTLGAALQAGVDVARGQVLLFLEEGAVAFPDLAEQHIRCHRDRPGQLLVAMGSREYPLEELGSAVARAISAASPTAWVMDRDGVPLQPAHHIHAGNMSLLRDAVISAGGFRANRGAAAAEDLGWRLHSQGYEALAMPDARVRLLQHTDLSSWLDEVEALEADRVGLHAEIPRALDASGHIDLTSTSLQSLLEAHGGTVPVVRAALDGMALGPNLYSLERVGGACEQLSTDLEARATELLTHLRRISEARGRALGLDAIDKDSYRAILRGQTLPLYGARTTRYLLRPSKSDEHGWLNSVAHFLVGFGPMDDTTLILLADPDQGGVDAEELRTGVLELTKRVEPGPNGGWADVQIAECSHTTGELERLLGSVQGWVPATGDGEDPLAVVAETSGTPIVDTGSWMLRGTDGVEPLPMATTARFRLFAWPDWSSAEELRTLFDAIARPLCNREDAALILRYDVSRDGDPEENLTRMAEAYEATFAEGYALEVVLVDNDGTEEGFVPRLAAAVSAVGTLPSSSEGDRKALLDALAKPRVSDMMSVTTELFSMAPLPLGPLYVPTLSLH